jgi:hypothetical protein
MLTFGPDHMLTLSLQLLVITSSEGLIIRRILSERILQTPVWLVSWIFWGPWVRWGSRIFWGSPPYLSFSRP